jgi:protein-S-isoprenylcysteine O-methyltransferase Ste14
MLLLFWRPPHSNYVNLPPLYPRTFEIADLGAVICLLGLLCALWARITLAGNWSGDVTLKQEHELVEKGPYRFVRHPIYTGMLMMSLGSSISIDTLRGFVGVVIIGLSFWYKLGQEEQLMLTHFPTQYESYKARVKAIVPFIV